MKRRRRRRRKTFPITQDELCCWLIGYGNMATWRERKRKGEKKMTTTTTTPWHSTARISFWSWFAGSNWLHYHHCRRQVNSNRTNRKVWDLRLTRWRRDEHGMCVSLFFITATANFLLFVHNPMQQRRERERASRMLCIQQWWIALPAKCRVSFNFSSKDGSAHWVFLLMFTLPKQLAAIGDERDFCCCCCFSSLFSSFEGRKNRDQLIDRWS